MKHTQEDAARIYDQCRAILERDASNHRATRNEETSWRMSAILRWWIMQMLHATRGDVEPIVRELHDAMKDMGIESQVMPVMASQTPQ